MTRRAVTWIIGISVLLVGALGAASTQLACDENVPASGRRHSLCTTIGTGRGGVVMALGPVVLYLLAALRGSMRVRVALAIVSIVLIVVLVDLTAKSS
jgi:hypothetical protein